MTMSFTENRYWRGKQANYNSLQNICFNNKKLKYYENGFVNNKKKRSSRMLDEMPRMRRDN